jgi:hypothetical protein
MPKGGLPGSVNRVVCEGYKERKEGAKFTTCCSFRIIQVGEVHSLIKPGRTC